MSKNSAIYRLNPQWRIVQEDNTLIISGGADVQYEVDLENSDLSFFGSLKASTGFERKNLSGADKRILEELVTAEVIVPAVQFSSTLRVSVIGDKNKLKKSKEQSSGAVDLYVIARTNSTYTELLEKIDYQMISKPHLFVDLAYHHTLSLGPLVFPGETACIACLQGRITVRWGDKKPPQSTQASTEYISLANEIINDEINRIRKGDTSLVNKTISWNFQDRTIRKHQLLKVPICVVCNKNSVDPDGKITLPWA